MDMEIIDLCSVTLPKLLIKTEMARNFKTTRFMLEGLEYIDVLQMVCNLFLKQEKI